MRQTVKLPNEKFRKTFFLASCVSILITVTLSCKKGDTGPVGPVGPAGTTGATGATGSKGDPGTANVIYSNWMYGTNPVDSTIDGSALKVTHLTMASITSGIVSQGTVLLYFTFGAGVFPLPYTSYAGGKANTVSFIPKAGGVLVTRFTLDNSNSIPLSTLLQYRIIIIPGGVSGARAATVDLNDYKAVCLAYNIPM